MEAQKDIHNYVDLLEIRKLLTDYPQLLLMFEMLCLHINRLIN